MSNHQDTRISFKELENHYSSNVSVAESMQFNVAFGLSTFDGSSHMEEHPDYATLEAQYRYWGLPDYDQYYGSI